MLIWSAHDLASGNLLADQLPVRMGGPLSAWIAKGEGLSISLPARAEGMRGLWRQWSDPRGIVAWAVRYPDTPPGERILWAGIVRSRSTSWQPQGAPRIELALLALDSLLDGLVIGEDVPSAYSGTYPQIARAMGLDLITRRYRGSVTMSDYGGVHERNWRSTDRKRAGDALRDLVGVIDGPEWVLRPRLDPAMRLCIDAEVGHTLGRGRPADGSGLRQMRAAWSRTWDCTPGRWATRVIGVADRSGAEPVVMTADASSIGHTETHVFSPDTGSVNVTGALGEHVAQVAKSMTNGIEVLRMHCPVDGLRVGIDLDLGDLATWVLPHPDLPELADQITARMLGWSLNVDEATGQPVSITPALEMEP